MSCQHAGGKACSVLLAAQDLAKGQEIGGGEQSLPQMRLVTSRPVLAKIV